MGKSKEEYMHHRSFSNCKCHGKSVIMNKLHKENDACDHQMRKDINQVVSAGSGQQLSFNLLTHTTNVFKQHLHFYQL